MSAPVEVGILVAAPGDPYWAQSSVGRICYGIADAGALAARLPFAEHLRDALGLDDEAVEMIRARLAEVATESGLYTLRVFVPEAGS